MNQLCKVCGEPAAGYHFGAFTCEGCKSFFGRTYNNLAALGECKNNGQCVINKKNRTSCKSCRLKKCLMVGMSKSGSRYGRRSNWFKIHCLIQDQAEMRNLAEQGVMGSNGQFSHPFAHENTKDLVSQYKQDSFRDTTSTSTTSSQHNNHHNHNHVSSNGASPSGSSEGSGGRAAVSSPYSALFETAKANGFASRYATSSPPFHESLHHHHHRSSKEPNNNHHHPFAFHPAALPLSPVSPLSPLSVNAASRFFFHPVAAAGQLFGKGLNGVVPKLYNGDLNAYAAYQSRFLPIPAINPVIKSSTNSKHNDDDHHPSSQQSPMGEVYADVPEQERPIDLSLKRGLGDDASSGRHSKSPKHLKSDHDSGFSPSSNEELNNNASPLDLTSKRIASSKSVAASASVSEPPTGDDNDDDDNDEDIDDDVDVEDEPVESDDDETDEERGRDKK